MVKKITRFSRLREIPNAAIRVRNVDENIGDETKMHRGGQKEAAGYDTRTSDSDD
jgi:hypothetical protein